MNTILFLFFGIMSILLVQIDVAYYKYLRTLYRGAEISQSIRIETMFNSRRRNFWRVVFTLAGMGLLYLSAYSCLENNPIRFPLILSFIFGFILWGMLLQVSIKFILSSSHKPTAAAIASTFLLPLILVGLVFVAAYLFPEIASTLN